MQKTKDRYAFGATGTELSKTLHENGLINSYVLTAPNFTNNVTATLSILDEDGDTIYTGDAKARNDTHLVTGLAVPMDRQFSAKVTLSGVAGGDGGTVTLKLFVENRR